ncbi:stress-induced protein YgiW, partial [Stenotrophomonas sp. HMWF023]
MENTMNRRLTLALLATSLSLLSAGAFAQYTGPGATSAVTTVAEARDQRDDQPVVLQGTLVAKIGHERYRFKDATGEIDVE